MKKVLKWGGIVLLIPVSLFILLSILLYLPPIQNFVVSQVTQVASESTGMNINIGRVSLSFPLNLVVHETTVNNETDTLLNVDKLKVEVQLWPLFHKKVEVDGLELEEANVNTGNLIEGMTIKGSMKNFYIESHGVELKPELAVINTIKVEDTDLDITLADTTAADTAVSDPVFWQILLPKIDLKNVSMALHMPLDSIDTYLKLGRAKLRDGNIDLRKSAYSLKSIRIEKSEASLITGNQTEPMPGFDPNFIQLTDIQIGVKDIQYEGDNIQADIDQFHLKERSGLEFIRTKGKLLADADHMAIPALEIKTANSYLKMQATADWSLSNINRDGSVNAYFLADISKNDLFKIIPDFPEQFKKDFPEVPVKLEMNVDGSLNDLRISAFDFEIPEHTVFETQGSVKNVMDYQNMVAAIELKGDFKDMRFMKSLMGDIVIPQGLSIKSKAEMYKDTLKADFSLLTVNEGTLAMNAHYFFPKDAYSARIHVNNLNLHAFMPKDSLFHLTTEIKAEGEGLDFLAPETYMKMEAGLPHFGYASRVFSGVKMDATLKNGKASANLNIADTHMAVNTQLNALLSASKISAEMNAAIRRLDLYSMGLSNTPLKSSQHINVKVTTDQKNKHSLRAKIDHNHFTVGEKSFATKDFLFGLDVTTDSIKSYANSGDLTFMFQSGCGVDSILSKIDKLSALIAKQWESHAIDQNELRRQLPDAHLRMMSGDENPVSNFMEANSIGFKEAFLQIDTSPIDGLTSSGYLHKLHTDSLMLDTISFNAEQVDGQLQFKSNVQANRNKNQEGFNIGIKGDAGIRNAKILVEYLNEENEQGAYIGMAAAMGKDGFRLNLIPDNPTLVYRSFKVNENNFVYINNKGKIEANLKLMDDANSGMHFFSTADSTAQQDVTLALNKINIEELRRIVPYMPDIKGLINAEMHYVQPQDGITLASIEASVDSLAYNKEPMGNWMANAVYLPKEKTEHCIDGSIMRNDEEIMNISGSYFSSFEETLKDKIDAELTLNQFPLELGNAFVSREMAVLSGKLDGSMRMEGSTDKPVLNGKVILDSVNVFIPATSMQLRFDKKPITVADSKLDFNKYNIYTLGESPFVIDGNIDFSDFSALMLDLNMSASDFELINGKKTKESLVYGKLYIDLSTTIKGTPDQLKVRGSANILGKSNFTYILKDSPLTIEDRLNETVTFVNFSDTTQAAHKNVQTISLGGMDMLMTLHIDQAVQGRVDLNANGSNYMIVEGGGDLSCQYTREGNIILNGRYSLIGGEMKYEMPVISLKTFQIKEGSFIEWTGNAMNPNLNIKAFEKVRASVSDDGRKSRMVTFNVGVNLTNRLENLGFTFTLEAPEDGMIQDELAGMSAEEKNKLAVTMLVTGLYIAESNASTGFDANSVLNSKLQSEINKIAGNALKTIDVNFGMETSNTGEGGGTSTDYNFQFAKRFWNNRFRVVIGGKITTGNNAKHNDSFIDNVSLEYRLDNSGTRYVKVFHDRKYANVLEGEVVETGAGIVLRKKVSKLGELFIFKKRKRNQNNADDKDNDENKKKDKDENEK